MYEVGNDIDVNFTLRHNVVIVRTKYNKLTSHCKSRLLVKSIKLAGIPSLKWVSARYIAIYKTLTTTAVIL